MTFRRPSRGPVRPAPERLLAWLHLGPLGHLYSALADIGVAAVRQAILRRRRSIARRRR